jgi:hypothetical protein
MDLVRVGLEVVRAQGGEAFQHGIDLELGGDEGVEGFGVVAGAAGGHGGQSFAELHRSGANTIALSGE